MGRGQGDSLGAGWGRRGRRGECTRLPGCGAGSGLMGPEGWAGFRPPPPDARGPRAPARVRIYVPPVTPALCGPKKTKLGILARKNSGGREGCGCWNGGGGGLLKKRRVFFLGMWLRRGAMDRYRDHHPTLARRSARTGEDGCLLCHASGGISQPWHWLGDGLCPMRPTRSHRRGGCAGWI